MLSPVQVRDAVISALHDQVPWSMVRLGDGERWAMESVGCADPADIRNRVWLNHVGVIPSDELKREWLTAAEVTIRGADVLGLHGGGHKYKATGDWFRERFTPKEQAKADVNHIMLDRGHLDEIMEAAERVVLVTGHDLADKGREHWPHLSRLEMLPVPLECKYFGHPGEHFPTVWRQTLSTILCRDWRGWLCLVGAGFVGKPYLQGFRIGGGVALDIGSVFDRWAGHCTRGAGKGTKEEDERYAL